MDFYVDPAALRQLANGVQAAGDRASQAAAGLASAASLPADAFGRLPRAQATQEQYVRKLQDATDALRRVQGTLQDVSARLLVTADNYESADQASSPRPR
jgi:uncharacterized protein YukE